MSELLPCPICGKKVYIGLYGGEPDYFWMIHGGMHYDECKCRLFMESCKFELEDESKVDYDKYAMKVRGGLVRRWNSRAEPPCGGGYCPLCGAAERTCECIVEYAKSPLDGKTIVLHRCSSCNELMRPHMNYCPNCGAKVVS